MLYTLFIITVTVSGYSTQLVDHYPTMQSCFQARTAVVQQLGKPVDNHYQAVCITRPL